MHSAEHSIVKLERPPCQDCAASTTSLCASSSSASPGCSAESRAVSAEPPPGGCPFAPAAPLPHAPPALAGMASCPKRKCVQEIHSPLVDWSKIKALWSAILHPLCVVAGVLDSQGQEHVTQAPTRLSATQAGKRMAHSSGANSHTNKAEEGRNHLCSSLKSIIKLSNSRK